MKKPVLAGIAVVLVLGAASYGGVHFWSQYRARSAIEDALENVRKSGAKASVGSSAVSLAERSLELSDLSVTSADGSLTLAIGHLAAKGMAPPQSGRISADSLVLENVTITRSGPAGQTAQTLPQVTIERYSGPLVPVPSEGASGVETLAVQQLASIDAARMTVPRALTRITPAAAAPDDDARPQEMTLDGVVATDLHGGRVGRLAIARLASQALPLATDDGADAAADSGLPRVDVEAIAVRDFNLADLIPTTSGGAAVPVLASLETGAFTIETDDDVRSEGASLRLTHVAIRPGSLTAPRITAFRQLVRNEVPSDAAAARHQLEEASALLAGLSFAEFEVKELRTIEPIGGGHATRLALDQLVDGRLGELRFEGVDGDSDGRSAKFGRISLTGLDLPRLLELSHTADPGAPDTALPLFRSLSGISASDLEVPTENADGEPGEPIRIGRMGLTWGDLGGDLPGRIRFEMADVSGPINAEDGEPFNTLAAAGMTRATFSLALGASYDAASQAVAITPAEMEVKDAFRLQLSGRMENLPPGAFATEDAFAAAAPDMSLGPLSLTVTDLGMANLVLQRLAEADGLSLDEYRSRLVELMGQLIEGLAPNAPEVAQVGEAVAAFIKTPGTLVFTATPKGRVPVLALLNSEDPTVALQLLSITAAYKP